MNRMEAMAWVMSLCGALRLSQTKTLAHLVGAEHVFAMYFGESHCLIGCHVLFQFARFDCDGHVVHAEKAGRLPDFIFHQVQLSSR